MRFPILPLLALTLGALPWRPALASDSPVIALIPLSEPAGQRASQALQESLRATGRVKLIANTVVETHLGRRAQHPPEQLLGAAQQHLDAGKAHFEAFRYPQALDELAKAKKFFRSLSYQEQAFEGLRVTQLEIARVYLAKKQKELAKKELMQVFVGDPERETRGLPEKHYTPDLRNLYEEVRNAYQSQLNASLLIETEPEGAVIYLNGKMLGPSPVTEMRLPPGVHIVHARLEGYEDKVVGKAVVAGNNTARLSLGQAMAQMPRFAPVPNKEALDHEQVAFLDGLSQKLRCDIFVFLAPGHGEISAQLYDQRSQEISQIVSGTSPEELSRQLIEQINSTGYVIATSNATESSDTPAPPAIINPKIRESELARAKDTEATPMQYRRKSSFWSSPWFWGAVGGAVVLGVGGYFAYDAFLKPDGNVNFKLNIPGR